VKPSALDTEPATLDGTLAEGERAAAPAVWKLRLVYAAGVGIGQSPPLVWDGQQPLEVGRRSAGPVAGAGLHVPDERVSRQHARLYRHRSDLVVEDLHSRNGSAVNGTRLSPGVPQPLRDGDVLRVGDSFVVLRYEPEVMADSPVSTYVGGSRAAGQVRSAIARCALHRRAVLILGETGTGKEVTAQALHQLSRRPGRLVAVNCAAIPGTLAEAQLFGVARGAFTGALERLGAFGEADGGTLFLDELGELPVEVQPKLLRTLETGEVLPVGGRHPIARDVRIVAATNRDLGEALRGKTFRDDLYARLTAEVLRLPPLRERREDILVLAQRFAGPGFHPTPRLVAALLAHRWPLNARQVGHVIARLQDRSEDEVLAALAAETAESGAAPDTVAGARGAAAAEPGSAPRWQSGDPVPARAQVVALLAQHRGNLSHIEAHSGYSRRQFRRWVQGYGLELAAFRNGAAE
jgi:DNA-binding NtrC family response regulator